MTIRLFPIILFLFAFSAAFSQAPLFESKTVFASEVYFDFGKHELRRDADTVLFQITTYISDKENLHIKITAHTDSIGSLKNNLALSNRRSEAVKAALATMGIADSLLTINTYGETMPASTNHTEDGRQLNRRATIEIVKYPPMTVLEGNVRDAVSNQGLLSMVIIRNNDWRDTLYTDTTGYYKKALPVGMVVGVDAFSDCHFFGSEMTKSQRKQRPLDFNLAPIITGATIDLNNLYFKGGLPILLEKSKPELPKIFRFMDSNPNMKIEIAGHVNVPNEPNVSEKSREFKLSQNRAWVVYNYLIERGISEERISFQGYGNWEMRFPKATNSKQMALNRRVEMKVLEGGCE